MLSKLRSFFQFNQKNYASAVNVRGFEFNSSLSDMNNYMREGYLSNAVLHRCINLIAGEIAKIPLVLKDEKLEPIDNINDPLLKLLSNPNLEQSKVEFINSVMINYLIYGPFFCLSK